jgi:hypothetical protein
MIPSEQQKRQKQITFAHSDPKRPRKQNLFPAKRTEYPETHDLRAFSAHASPRRIAASMTQVHYANSFVVPKIGCLSSIGVIIGPGYDFD